MRLYVFYRLFNDCEELENAEHDTNCAVDSHKRTDQTEDKTDDRNTCEDADEPANNCTYNKENNKLNKKRNDILFFYLKTCRPKFLEKIHLGYLQIKY